MVIYSIRIKKDEMRGVIKMEKLLDKIKVLVDDDAGKGCVYLDGVYVVDNVYEYSGVSRVDYKREDGVMYAIVYGDFERYNSFMAEGLKLKYEMSRTEMRKIDRKNKLKVWSS